MTTESTASSGAWTNSTNAAAPWSACRWRARCTVQGGLADGVPSQTRNHMRAAWRENLLAVRSMIDFWADRLADDAPDDSDSNSGRQNIPID